MASTAPCATLPAAPWCRRRERLPCAGVAGGAGPPCPGVAGGAVCRATALAVVLSPLVMIKIPGHPRLSDDPKGPEAVIFGVQADARPAAAPIRGRAAPRPRVPRLVCPAPSLSPGLVVVIKMAGHPTLWNDSIGPEAVIFQRARPARRGHTFVAACGVSGESGGGRGPATRPARMKWLTRAPSVPEMARFSRADELDPRRKGGARRRWNQPGGSPAGGRLVVRGSPS